MMQLDVKLSFKHRSQNCSCVSWISSDTISPLQKLWPKKDHRVSKGPGLVVLIERLLFCIHAFIAAIWQRNFHHEDIWQCNSNEAFSESPLRDVWKCNFNVHVLWRAPLRGPRIYRMKTYTQVYTRDHKGLGRSIWKALWRQACSSVQHPRPGYPWHGPSYILIHEVSCHDCTRASLAECSRRIQLKRRYIIH